MVKEKIPYVDYNGNNRTEEFYFNLSESDLLKLMSDAEGEDLVAMLQRISESGDARIVFETFNKILSLAYGEKSQDGRRLVKGKEVWKAFTETPAYDALLMKMLKDPAYSANFINNLIPEHVIENLKSNAGTENSISLVK